MILAAPLVIPFSQAVPALAGLTGMLGMAALSEKVNEYIQENPEESMKNFINNYSWCWYRSNLYEQRR